MYAIVCHTNLSCKQKGGITVGFPKESFASTKKLAGSCAGALPVAGPNARVLLGSGGPARMHFKLGKRWKYPSKVPDFLQPMSGVKPVAISSTCRISRQPEEQEVMLRAESSWTKAESSKTL